MLLSPISLGPNMATLNEEELEKLSSSEEFWQWMIRNFFRYLEKYALNRFVYDPKSLFIEELHRRYNLECSRFNISMIDWLKLLSGDLAFIETLKNKAHQENLYVLAAGVGHAEALPKIKTITAAKRVLEIASRFGQTTIINKLGHHLGFVSSYQPCLYECVKLARNLRHFDTVNVLMRWITKGGPITNPGILSDLHNSFLTAVEKGDLDLIKAFVNFVPAQMEAFACKLAESYSQHYVISYFYFVRKIIPTRLMQNYLARYEARNLQTFLEGPKQPKEDSKSNSFDEARPQQLDQPVIDQNSSVFTCDPLYAPAYRQQKHRSAVSMQHPVKRSGFLPRGFSIKMQ